MCADFKEVKTVCIAFELLWGLNSLRLFEYLYDIR